MFSYRRSWVNPLGGELLVNGQIGRQSKLGAEFYQPLANDSPLFVAPYAALGKSVRPIYAGDQHLADLVTRDARLGVDLGAALGHWGELRIGALLRQSNAITETGPEALPDIRTTDNGLRLRIFGDQLDAPWFPRSGHRVMLEAYEAVPALGNGPRYHRVDLSLTRAYTLGDQSIEATLGAARADSWCGSIPVTCTDILDLSIAPKAPDAQPTSSRLKMPAGIKGSISSRPQPK